MWVTPAADAWHRDSDIIKRCTSDRRQGLHPVLRCDYSFGSALALICYLIQSLFHLSNNIRKWIVNNNRSDHINVYLNIVQKHWSGFHILRKQSNIWYVIKEGKNEIIAIYSEYIGRRCYKINL